MDIKESIEKEVSTKAKPKKAVDKEKANLKKENKDMAKMLKEMQEQMLEMQTKIANPTIPKIELEQNSNITRIIKVMSLVDNVLTLSTMRNGNKAGRTYRFDKCGQTRPILFSDIQAILVNHSSQFESQKVILTYEKDYNDLGIGYMYNSEMTKEKINEMIKLESDKDIELILGLNEEMQEKVIDMIAQKIVDGFGYDYNRIKKLEKEGFVVQEIADEIDNVPSKKDEDED